jgi:hypothetical protein
LIAHHAIFLWLSRPRERDRRAVDRGAPRPESIVRAQSIIEGYFSLRTLLIRYGLPAIFLTLAGIISLKALAEPQVAFSLFVDHSGTNATLPKNIECTLRGARFGAVGAYVYVLVDLGRRVFRHDITSGSAMWCVVNLILGPVLAAVVALVWRMKGGDDQWWQDGVVLFFTGFAPKRVLAAIEQAGQQLLKLGPGTSVTETRLVPLGRVRGIGPQIEERLAEEGIYDVNALANAEPVRLVRNTSYDMRQIISWIDEAILIVTLPRSWQSLEDAGVTGAIDLAWYYLDIRNGAIAPELKDLAAKAQISEGSLLSVVRRLWEDAQIQQIWALYYAFAENVGDEDPDSPPTTPDREH